MYLTHLVVPTDYVDKPKADDFVHADLLKEAINDGCVCCINNLIDAINLILRDDGTLKDAIIRARMLHPEVINMMLGVGQSFEARAVATTDVVLSGLQTIDGVPLTTGDIICCIGQNAPSQNGLWLVSSGLWVRPNGFLDQQELTVTSITSITEGTEYRGSSWLLLVPEGETLTIGSDNLDYTLLFRWPDQTLTQDQIDALAGTEGTPSTANRFVTDEDTRLAVFTDLLDGLVPAPGATSTCNRFLCENGTWGVPADVALVNAMFNNIDNVMEDTGFITFNNTIGIRGLDDPTDPDHAANMNYVDTLIASIDGSVTALTDWKAILDAINGVIQCDGGGNYSAWTPLSSLVTDDSVFGGGGQSVAASIDLIVAAINANTTAIGNNATAIGVNAGDIATINALNGVVIGNGVALAATPLSGNATDYLDGTGGFSALPSGLVAEYGENYGNDGTLFNVAGTWYSLGGSLSAGPNNNNFTAGTTTLTYNGAGGVFQVEGNLSGMGLSSPDTCEFGIAKNGTVQASSVQAKNLVSGGDGSITVSAIVALANGDTLNLAGRALAVASATFSASKLNLNAMN